VLGSQLLAGLISRVLEPLPNDGAEELEEQLKSPASPSPTI